MKKVELLAPAGNFDGLTGAINAGADAVYLGGQLFGARAYADNFSEEEICRAIHMAHVLGKRIYLTVNTLVKEKELDKLYDFLLPFYLKGLDGVIVQDLGALKYIKEHFPEMELHASTQMSLTGSRGTKFVQEAGVCRIVPARELSLAEMKEIKERTGVEIEAFIHGAMCYCYSGQCLLSSILGGRSGNRGRCAQPCRLPYSVEGSKECYPLSMRDMCTLDILPRLIEAGITSFKIEGRMKKPFYTAGVTAIYRKYIDLYYADKAHYSVEEKDREWLKALYIRSEIGEGYYDKHNGKDMLTIDSPAYSGTDEELLCQIEKKYMKRNMQIPVSAEVFLESGQPAILNLYADKCYISCTGEMVQPAIKQPLCKEKITEQIKKSGNTLVKIEQINVHLNGDVFMPVRALNELRRDAIVMMEEELIRSNGLLYEERKTLLQNQNNPAEKYVTASGGFGKASEKDTRSLLQVTEQAVKHSAKMTQIHVLVSDLEQLQVAKTKKISRIYLDYGLEQQLAAEAIFNDRQKREVTYYVTTPYIVREKDIPYLERIAEKLREGIFDGVLVRNLESYHFLKEKKVPGEVVLDHNMYLWNRESWNCWKEKAEEFYLPIELNAGEWSELLAHMESDKLSPSVLVYGRVPMMISSNCVRKTLGKCEKNPGISTLKDRFGKEFPVYTDCKCCYNVIYNSVPLSLHGLFKKQKKNIHTYRLDFTLEDKITTEKVVDYFEHLMAGDYQEPFYQEFTTGHYKRGVE